MTETNPGISTGATNSYEDGVGDGDRLRRQAIRTADRFVGILREAGLAPGMRVLDAGCGFGVNAWAISEAFEDLDVVAIDHDATAIAEAQREFGSARLRFEVADIHATGQSDAQFDMVAVSLVLMHLSDPVGALKECVRVLKPGGRLCVVDTDDGYFHMEPRCPAFERLKALLGAWYEQCGGSRQRGRQLPRLITESGLRITGMSFVVLDSVAIGEPCFDAMFLEIFRVQLPRIVKAGLVDQHEATALLDELDAAAAAGFFATISGVSAVAIKP